MSLIVIGDIHGRMGEYSELVKDLDKPTVQLGDLGFSEHYRLLDGFEVESDLHKFIPGNHDDYNNLPFHAINHPYGFYEHNGVRFFFVRGALSIDKAKRVPGVSWFEEEEITYREGLQALSLYAKIKPDLVLSHDCPIPACKEMGFSPIPSRTAQLLSVMWEHHHPKLWVFGHYHKDASFRLKQGGSPRETKFRCLNTFSYAMIDQDREDLSVKISRSRRYVDGEHVSVERKY